MSEENMKLDPELENVGEPAIEEEYVGPTPENVDDPVIDEESAEPTPEEVAPYVPPALPIEEVHTYAQVNLETGMIEAVSYISGTVECENLILIPDGFNYANKKYVDGEWVEYTPDPVPEVPTPKTNAELEAENELLKAQVSALSDQLDFQEECLVEMASIVYA